MAEDIIQGEGFTVKDKRTFDTEGEVREEFKRTKKEEAKTEEAKEKAEGEAPLPEVNFSSFLLSLSSSTLLHLGEVADPQSGEKRKDLALAKQSIDIIALLKEKTAGNLTQEEERLLEHLLYDLRMRFVNASKE